MLRASDADRDVALALLREASVDGRLTIEELAARAELVSTARTRDEVAAATADLAASSPPLVQDVARCRALFSTVKREGRWRIAARGRYSGVFGNVKLDLRDAVLPGPEIEIEARTIFGGVQIILPQGVHVELTGGASLASQELKVEGEPPDGAPVIRIHHRGAFGSLVVRSKPRLGEQLKESWRQWAERLSQPPG